MANEFHGRLALCDNLIPTGKDFGLSNQVCAITGSTAGSPFVSGDDYIKASFTYSYAHVWRNFGVLIGFWIFFSLTYALATELQNPAGAKGKFLIFKRGHAPEGIEFALQQQQEEKTSNSDLETGVTEQNTKEELQVLQDNSTSTSSRKDQGLVHLIKSTDVFTWQNVCYDLPLKDGLQRRLLDHVHGYVKPGTLTALMGESGAGKTTLLNVLAQRVDTGVVTGDILVNGSALDISFQRRSGYVQQQVRFIYIA